MGWITNTKSKILFQDAQKAWEAGHMVFAPMLNTPAMNSGLSGAVGDWAEMIEAVEAVGWRLTNWAIGSDTRGRPQAYPLFRRVGTESAGESGRIRP